MDIREEGEVSFGHGGLVLLVKSEHLLASCESFNIELETLLLYEGTRKRTVVASERLDERGEDSRLNHLVVDHGRLGGLVSLVRHRSVLVTELATNGAVLRRERGSAILGVVV